MNWLLWPDEVRGEKVLGIRCGDQIYESEMKGRLGEWVVTQKKSQTAFKTHPKTSSKLKTFALWKALLIEGKDKLKTRRKYSQIKYLTKDSYPEYITNSQNTIVRKQPNLKMGKRFK